jgi:hypothetical protein
MLLGALALAAGVSWGSALAASATTVPQLSVSLYSNGDSTAVWDTNGNPVLTAGTDSGTSAQVQVHGVHGTQAPTTEPAFTASPAASAGDPRWVMEFHNGQYLFGSDTNTPAATRWDVNPGGPQGVSYATALAAANAGGLDNYLTSVFIVADAGNHGITYTLTNIQFGGASANAVLSGMVQVKNRATGKCLNEDQGNGLLLTYSCVPQTYVSLRWQTMRLADGVTELRSVQTGLVVRDNGQGGQLELTSSESPMRFLNGGVFAFQDNLVVTVNSQGNFAKVVGEPGLSPLNNGRWDFGAV